MAKFSKCQCNELVRDGESDFLLTTHHPKCSFFNPASELYGLEQQCKYFIKIISDLKSKLREMQEIVDS